MSLEPGQASIEMAVAMILSLLLMGFCAKICFWFAERFVLRQQAYEETRTDAANRPGMTPWVELFEKLTVVDSGTSGTR